MFFYIQYLRWFETTGSGQVFTLFGSSRYMMLIALYGFFRVLIRIRCHCTMSQLYVKCGDWTTAEDATKELLGCCKDQCPKLMSCSHRYIHSFLRNIDSRELSEAKMFIFRCFRTCHSGKCGSEKDCKKKVKLFCPCKRLKVDSTCSLSKTVKVDCDSSCEEAKIMVKLQRHPKNTKH